MLHALESVLVGETIQHAPGWEAVPDRGDEVGVEEVPVGLEHAGHLRERPLPGTDVVGRLVGVDEVELPVGKREAGGVGREEANGRLPCCLPRLPFGFGQGRRRRRSRRVRASSRRGSPLCRCRSRRRAAAGPVGGWPFGGARSACSATRRLWLELFTNRFSNRPIFISIYLSSLLACLTSSLADGYTCVK